MISDPRVSTIHAIALSLPHHFLLSASETFGVASRCDPFSGKVAKGFVDASGQMNGLGMGVHQPLAMEQVGEEVSCISLDSDASRIVWGYHSGEIGMTTLARQGTNPRGLIKGIRFSPRGGHAGAVLAACMPFGTGFGGAHSIERSPERMKQRQAMLGEAAEVFATAGIDGTVRLWTPKKALPIWVEVAQHAPVQLPGQVYKRPAPAVCVDVHLESGTIAVATAEGEVTVWTNVDVNGLIDLPASAYEDPSAFPATPALLQSRAELKRIEGQIRRINLPRPRVVGSDGGHAPGMLVLDIDSPWEGTFTPTNLFHARLLIFCVQGAAFERLEIHKEETAEAVVSSSVFSTPGNVSITALRPDFDLEPARKGPSTSNSPAYAERKSVCAGTSEGKVVIWDWTHEAEGNIEAWCSLDGHHTSITALDVTAHVIIIGCSDGTIKAFCPLTGQLIRTFNDRTATRHPARMLAAGELTEEEASRFVVSQIIAGPDTVVASIGGQVLAWRAEKIKGKSARKVGHRATSGKASVGRLWDPKLQSQKEMERDVFETREQLREEQKAREAEYERIKYSVGGRSEMEMSGLSEQEAFEYAMMLSRDEEEVRRSGAPVVAGGANVELEEALEQIALAESSVGMGKRPSTSADDSPEEGQLDDSYEVDTSGSLSPEQSSPYLHGLSSPVSRAWDILHQAGSSASPASRNQDRWHPNNKVSIINVPLSARLSSSQSSASTSRRPSSHQPTPPGLDSPHDWPSFEPSSFSSRSPGPWHLGSPATAPSLPTSRLPAASPTLAPVKNAAMGAWAGGSPSLRPVADAVGSPRLSALSTSKPRASTLHANDDDDLDEELRYAIQLSLAEEQSRQTR